MEIDKSILKSNNLKILYPNKNEEQIINGIELPNQWITLNKHDLEKQARNAIFKMSESSNLALTAQELGFKNTKHFIEICFNYILK